MTNITECTQTKCSFHKSNGGEMLCPECASCNSPSNIIDEDCVNCWNCLKDVGYIRSGIPKAIKEKVKQMIKDNVEQEIIITNKTELINQPMRQDNERFNR